MRNQLFIIALVTISPFVYSQSVIIGEQVWMKENLNVGIFRNGDLIPEAQTNAEWNLANKNKHPAWCYYDNDPVNGIKYGRLYNWYAVADPRGLCPTGWHVPTTTEWYILSEELGGENVAGVRIRSSTGWNDPLETVFPVEGIDKKKSGFSGLPGGLRDYHDTFSSIDEHAFWWSATEYGIEYGEDLAWNRWVPRISYGIYREKSRKGDGMSVRCLRD
jgi:uncharacterized protein (TIGR02145 family)